MRDTAGLAAVRASFAPVARFFTASPWRARIGQPGVADFAFGNPQETSAKRLAWEFEC